MKPMKPKTPLAESVQEDVVRMRRELLKLVRLAGIGHAEIDARNGWNDRYTSQILQGNLHLTMRHLIGILWVLGIPLERFLAHCARRQSEP